MCQRDDRRFEIALVTSRRVQVAKRGVRSDYTSARTRRDECAVPAFLPGTESEKPFPGRFAPGFAAIVDVPGRKRLVSGRSRARVERSIGSDRVRVLTMNVARTLRHAIRSRQAVAPCFLAQLRHLVVEGHARIAARSAARPSTRHARAAQRLDWLAI